MLPPVWWNGFDNDLKTRNEIWQQESKRLQEPRIAFIRRISRVITIFGYLGSVLISLNEKSTREKFLDERHKLDFHRVADFYIVEGFMQILYNVVMLCYYSREGANLETKSITCMSQNQLPIHDLMFYALVAPLTFGKVMFYVWPLVPVYTENSAGEQILQYERSFIGNPYLEFLLIALTCISFYNTYLPYPRQWRKFSILASMAVIALFSFFELEHYENTPFSTQDMINRFYVSLLHIGIGHIIACLLYRIHWYAYQKIAEDANRERGHGNAENAVDFFATANSQRRPQGAPPQKARSGRRRNK